MAPLTLAQAALQQAIAEGFAGGPLPTLNSANVNTQTSIGNPLTPVVEPAPAYPPATLVTPNLGLSLQDLSVVDANNMVIIDAFAKGGGVAGGDTQVQYNKAGVFGADANFVWNYSSGEVVVNNTLSGSGSGAALAIGTPLGTPVSPGGIMLTGSTVGVGTQFGATLEIHNAYSNGIAIFSHTVASSFRAPVVSLAKSRGTQQVPTAISNGDAIGYWQFQGYTGSAYVTSLFGEAVATENWGASNNGTSMSWTITPTGSPASSSVIALTLNSDGNAGVAVSHTLYAGVGLSNGPAIVIPNPQSPTSGATQGVTGQIAWDATNLYVCTAGGSAGAATWKKLVLQAD